ncbi:MAG: thioesterase family protein [Vicinamibacterales bacterium]
MSEFRYHRRVEFADTDLAGIVHFSVIFRYMEEAEHAMWRAAGLSIADRGNDLGWPRVSAACEFRNPLLFEDQFEVWVRLAAARTRALDYEFTIVRGETVIAVGTMTSVCVRKTADGGMKATEVPVDILSRLRDLQT